MAHPELTSRQRQVMERLDRRIPIKQIAADLELSEIRIKQIVADLKRLLGANNLTELVARYRVTLDVTQGSEPYPKGLYTKGQVPLGPGSAHPRPRVDGELVLADVQSIPIDAPWATTREPQVVPGVLNGNHALVRRLAVMFGLAAAMVAALILVITATSTVSELFKGVATVPEEQAARDD